MEVTAKISSGGVTLQDNEFVLSFILQDKTKGATLRKVVKKMGLELPKRQLHTKVRNTDYVVVTRAYLCHILDLAETGLYGVGGKTLNRFRSIIGELLAICDKHDVANADKYEPFKAA